jgi:hypothetical protein
MTTIFDGEVIRASTLEVRKDNLSDTRVVTDETIVQLSENEVLLQIDRLALTANNISYAASGDALGYWRFFPADDGWGRVPAMGWADVVASNHADIVVGERVWGFFPFSTHLKILAGKVSQQSFSDVSVHRDGLAPVYAQFDRASAYAIYEQAREDQDSLLRGLYMTSWLVADFMEMNDFFGASSCLITSASSKTSIALGHCVQRQDGVSSIALTSAGNVAFCESLGCYDSVLTYEQISALDGQESVVVVDMAGSASILSELHHHYADTMKYSCRIGATHVDSVGAVHDLPGATPEFFFAPGHIQIRSKELGPAELMMRLGSAYVAFRQFCDTWLQVEDSFGAEAVTAVYQRVRAGKADPATGQIISLWEQP